MLSTPMSPGQLKQIATKLIQSIPTDLTSSEAEKLLKSVPARIWLDEMWKKLREEPGFEISVPASAYEALLENHFWLDIAVDVGTDTPSLVLEKMQWANCEGSALVHVVEVGSSELGEVLRQLKAKGYRSADARELVGFILQYPSFTKDYRNLAIIPQHAQYFLWAWYNYDCARTEFAVEVEQDYCHDLPLKVLAVKV